MTNDLNLALEYHRRGWLDQAAHLYQHVLAARPDHADALHLLGVVAHQRGEFAHAAECIGAAIVRNPRAPTYHANLAEVYRAQGRLEQAAACGRIALRLQPDHPEAANNLGTVLLEQGQVEAAAEQFRIALRARPNFALAVNNLGNALRLLGDTEQALAHFRKAVELDPYLAMARTNLGQILADRRQLHEALEHCRAAVHLRPGFAEAYSNLGNVLRELGRLEDAKGWYSEALRLNPDLAMVYNNMGQALQEDGKLDEAAAWYGRGLELDPKLARLHCNLASLLDEREMYAEAIARYELALRLDRKYAEAYSGLGRVLHEQGRYEEAQERYQTALRLKPDLAVAHCNLGTVRQELSDFVAAENCFRESLRHDPRQTGAWCQLATMLRGRLPEDDLAGLRRLLADSDLTDAKRAPLHFGLAEVLDARKDYAAAAEHLSRANAITLTQWQKRGLSYDAAAHTTFVDRLLATFTPAFFERARGFGVDSERPIFIVGLPRSGTTLTEQVLAGHSQVFGAGELSLGRGDFLALGGDSGEDEAFAQLARLDGAMARRLATRHLEGLQALSQSVPHVADKMPDNYLYLGLLALLFPRARFIHCRRDLRDVAVSCWMTNFRHIRWANDPDHIAARFADYRRVLDHWRRVLLVPLLEVDYEETVVDLEGVARRLVSWCGLEWEAGCLAFHEGKRPVRTASVTQVRQPIYTRSLARWKHYEAALGSLFAKLCPLLPSEGLTALSPGRDSEKKLTCAVVGRA
jgi:tetratricopeptide (TPR) repeat protein